MKAAAALIALLVVLLVGDAIGQGISRGRCKCQDGGVKLIRPKLIESLEVIPSSSSCDKVEIIVTLKNGDGKKCLNPESPFAQNYIKRSIKKRSVETKP
ncbi:C-X-C motif chemokine 11-6-like [Engraulis encrasicolus]|uniref:C-X-C motif chemokine 11-6-like n=1 Tax=Engraulis encrasicolus TaxID=184585 RepID=UPI002FD61088